MSSYPLCLKKSSTCFRLMVRFWDLQSKFRKGSVASFCLVASDSTEALDVFNSYLLTSASYTYATCYALSKAVNKSLRNIFRGQGNSFFISACVFSLFSRIKCVFTAQDLDQSSCQLFLAYHPSSPCYFLVRLWAETPTKGVTTSLNVRALQS